MTDKERLADIWRRSRAKSGKSQEYVALELGVTRKTIQNWEKGVSSPTLDQVGKWFKALELPAHPYILSYLYPDTANLSEDSSSEELRTVLMHMLGPLPEESIRQLLFLFYGEHGSSPKGILQMLTAHLQCPMKDRFNSAAMIAKNYEIAEKKGRLSSPKEIKPDLDFLKKAIEEGEQAVLRDEEHYDL